MINLANNIPQPQAADNPRQSLREEAQRLLMINSPQEKAIAVRRLDTTASSLDIAQHIPSCIGIPGRPEKPALVPHSALKNRAVGTLEGRACLIHALTHIEANAINLALDLVWRFDGMPETFYRNWAQVAQEEALHFDLLENHLKSLGFSYGDFPAHDGLWAMAEKTKNNLLARLALVPRTLEARGLDATPAIRNKLVSVGDQKGAAILDIILRDEIGHVATGNQWYHYLCAAARIDPISTYAELTRQFAAPVLQGPFNLPARRAAGFSEAELSALCHVFVDLH